MRDDRPEEKPPDFEGAVESRELKWFDGKSLVRQEGRRLFVLRPLFPAKLWEARCSPADRCAGLSTACYHQCSKAAPALTGRRRDRVRPILRTKRGHRRLFAPSALRRRARKASLRPAENVRWMARDPEWALIHKCPKNVLERGWSRRHRFRLRRTSNPRRSQLLRRRWIRRGSREIPRIAGFSDQQIVAFIGHQEFGGIGIAEDDRAGRTQASDQRRIVLRHVVLAEQRARRARQSCYVDVALDRDRHAVERAERVVRALSRSPPFALAPWHLARRGAQMRATSGRAWKFVRASPRQVPWLKSHAYELPP